IGMRRKTGLGPDLVVVPDADRAPAHAGGIVITGEREVVTGVQPAVIGMAETVERTNIDHCISPYEARRWRGAASLWPSPGSAGRRGEKGITTRSRQGKRI